MRFLGYTLGDPISPLPQPDPELFEQMGKFVEEATNAGVLLATGGVVEPGPDGQGRLRRRRLHRA